MSSEFKPLSKEGIPKALEKAERYRLLNEPLEAESICLDVLRAESKNQKALVILILALTDQYIHRSRRSVSQPSQFIAQLESSYERSYYSGIVCERRAKAILIDGSPGSSFIAYDLLHDAMRHFEEAEKIRQPGNDDALLRWNACLRVINSYNLTARQEEREDPVLE